MHLRHSFVTGSAFVRAVSMAAVLAWVLPCSAREELGASASEADATVGCLFPLAGRAAIYGRDSIAAIKLALQEVQRDTSPGWHPKLRVIVEDDRSKAAYGTRLASEFIDRDHAKFLCGVVSSGVAQAVNRLSKTRKVIFVGTDHASSRLTIEGFHRYYFRVSNDTYSSMAAGALFLTEQQRTRGWKRIAFIGADYDYGHVMWSDLQSALARTGAKFDVVELLWPKLYEPDYSAYLTALARSKPDVIVAGLWGGDFLAFLAQARSAGLLGRVPMANFDAGGNYDVLVALGDVPPKDLVLSARHHNNWPDTPRNRQFVEAFHSAEGRYPTYAAEGAYAGILAIARAMAKSGKHADVEALVRAMEGMCLDLPEDPPGSHSCIDASTHQIAQAQAIGEVVVNTAFPPAKLMLGNWHVYSVRDVSAPPDLVQERRRAASLAP
jgi:branched-chain amino acid transport system substrate-binding protein